MKQRGLSRRKRCIACASAVTNYIVDISKDVDREKFEKLTAVNKEITLAFAIKDTGSMAIEIMVTEPSRKDRNTLRSLTIYQTKWGNDSLYICWDITEILRLKLSYTGKKGFNARRTYAHTHIHYVWYMGMTSNTGWVCFKWSSY